MQETITSFIHVFCWRSVVFINLDGKRRIPRVSYFVPSGKIPKDPISNEEKKRREGSNAERTALGPDADLLPIPYPSIVELRWDEFSESPSQRPREREAPICSEDPRARAHIHPSIRTWSGRVSFLRALFRDSIGPKDRYRRPHVFYVTHLWLWPTLVVVHYTRASAWKWIVVHRGDHYLVRFGT